MHAETLAYLLHQLPYRMKRKREEPPAPPAGGGAVDRTIRIPAGQATLKPLARGGRLRLGQRVRRAHRRRPRVHRRRAQGDERALPRVRRVGRLSEPVPLDGRELGVEGEREAQAPDLLVEAGRGWKWRGMFSETPLPERAAVYVSHAEASAFARWAGRALPSEAQFHRAAYGTPRAWSVSTRGGTRGRARSTGTSISSTGTPRRSERIPPERARSGHKRRSETDGSGPRRCSSLLRPRAAPALQRLLGRFLRRPALRHEGGSRTAACMLRRSYRNWFQPRYPYVYAAFRTVGERGARPRRRAPRVDPEGPAGPVPSASRPRSSTTRWGPRSSRRSASFPNTG